MMAGFRLKDTRLEMLVSRALHKLGFRFRLHRRDLPGRPDIGLPRNRTAILVHGCFWHQHTSCRDARMPRTRPHYWIEKFRRNAERDKITEAALLELGWKVDVVWECEARRSDIGDRLLGFLAPPGQSS